MKIPEHISIYKSMLEMAVCRGDIPSVKLALKYILLKDNAINILLDSLHRIALQQFSYIYSPPDPVDLQCLEDDILYYATQTSVDFRALSLSILYFHSTLFQIELEFKEWEKSYHPAVNISSLKQLIQYKAAVYLDEYRSKDCLEAVDNNLLDIPIATSINYDYFLGDCSWVRPHVDSFFKVSAPNVDITNVITVFEINKTNKNIHNSHYWNAVKEALFVDPIKMESVWETILKPRAMNLIINQLTFAQPILMNGLD